MVIEAEPSMATDPDRGPDRPLREAPIVVADARVDSPGEDDTEANEASVTVRNVGDNPVPLGNWWIEDEAGHRFTFPAAFTLAAGESVTVRTGDGPDGETELSWDAKRASWTENGETVRLFDDTDALVVKRSL